MLVVRFVLLLLVAALLGMGCATAQLSDAAERMIQIERGTSAVVEGVVVFKDATKADCVAKKLPTEAERAACVKQAVRAVEISEVGVLAIKAALASFWEFYGVVQARRQAEDQLRREDLLELLSRAGRVVTAYGEFVKAVKEAKQ